MGDHAHRRSRAGRTGHGRIESLTERELQVARLVVDRRTNAEIADALFLSPKTIESHIRNIFHKLDVSTRVELARTVERVTGPPARPDRLSASRSPLVPCRPTHRRDEPMAGVREHVTGRGTHGVAVGDDYVRRS